MKKNYVLTSVYCVGLSFLGANLNAQTSIPADSANYVIGENTKVREIANASTFGQGPAGAAIAWDFSTLAAGTERDLKVEAVVTGGINPDPVNAALKVVVDRPLNDEVYFYNPSASALGYAGLSYGVNVLNYEGEGAEQWSYPITYQSTKTVNVANEYTSGFAQAAVDHKIAGTVRYEVDAYGRIKMPYGDVYNVLRIKIEEDIIDSADVPILGRRVFVHDNTMYEWRTISNKHFILRFDNKKVGSTSTRTVFYQVGDSVNPGPAPSSVGIHIPKMPDFMVFPNPASDVISVSFDVMPNEVAESIRLMDMQGRQVKQFETYAPKGDIFMESYDVSDLPRGNYIISMQSNQRSLQKRISIH